MNRVSEPPRVLCQIGRYAIGIVWLCSANLGAQKLEQRSLDTAIDRWAVVGEIAGTPAGRTIRSPWMARHLDTLYATANLFPVDGSKIGRRAAIILRQPGVPLALPEGDYLFAF